jgi:endogenous inhibitor of DNA gyrase (YacG/DUF329 family)
METTRPCKDCGKLIDLSVGRRDRQFCNETCKNRYHNKQAFEEEKEAKRIVKILKKNRGILKKMSVRKDSDQISKERLQKEGFSFDYHTHFKNTKFKGYQYTFCFDYGYRPTKEKDHFKIVKAFEYKEE